LLDLYQVKWHGSLSPLWDEVELCADNYEVSPST